MRRLLVTLLVLLPVLLAPAAQAALPATETLLKDVGFSDSEVASLKAGKIVRHASKSANERDLAAAFAFVVKMSPAELVKVLKGGLLLQVDPNTIASGTLSGAGSADDLAKLQLAPDSAARAKKYGTAKPGDDLNLSTEEIASFSQLGASAAAPAVADRIRGALLARYQAYHSKGLAGIVAYDRGGGKTRSPGEELSTALKAVSALQKYAPAAYDAMLNYPGSRPEGTDETFRWVQFKAHDVPTFALVQGLWVPDGDAFIVMQRQYYVSEGYNSEQAIAGLLPTEGGTVVLYVNHTSTDQVSGFGGGVKRSIGSGMMASQLEDLFTKLQQQKK